MKKGISKLKINTLVVKEEKLFQDGYYQKKQEEGVFFRQDRGELMVSIPADLLFFMMSMIKKDLNKN